MAKVACAWDRGRSPCGLSVEWKMAMEESAAICWTTALYREMFRTEGKISARLGSLILGAGAIIRYSGSDEATKQGLTGHTTRPDGVSLEQSESDREEPERSRLGRVQAYHWAPSAGQRRGVASMSYGDPRSIICYGRASFRAASSGKK
jgi:hypothetical protein